ncbi:MAG: hypothetical protein Q9160_009115 [Pyrenula sp. 1 TL-2023]
MAAAIYTMSAAFAAPVEPKPDDADIPEPYTIGTRSLNSLNSVLGSRNLEYQGSLFGTRSTSSHGVRPLNSPASKRDKDDGDDDIPEPYTIGTRSVRTSKLQNRDEDEDADIPEPFTIGTRKRRSNSA